MNYFIVVNNSHAGPYTIEQLKEMNLSPDTYAWCKGMKQWALAKDIPELAKALWAPPVPPQAPEPLLETHLTKEPPTYLAWSIITCILFCTPLGIVALIFSGITNTRRRKGEIEKARKSSELAYWFGIGAFVLGLILIPFQLLIQFVL